MSEDEYYEQRCNLIKETFSEEDFLSCAITRDRLHNEFFWEWEKNCAPQIEHLYNGVRRTMQETMATPLFYDKTGIFSSDLLGIVFKYIRREYDIGIFHDCPSLADPLIRQYEEIKQKRKDAMKEQRKVNSNIAATPDFDWTSKTHK
jgi:hypothetical protein